MPSDVDQAAPQQSIEERIGNHLWGDAPETPEVEEAPEETSDQVTDEPDEETPKESAAVDEVEIEVEGWKGKIPAKLKAEIDKGQDYTRKTQSLADEKRLFETQIRAVQEQNQFMQAAQAEIERFRNIESQLEQYRGVDLSQIDSETLSRMSMAAGNLREERAKLKETIDAKRGEFQQKLLTAWDEMTTRARDLIVKDIPQWGKVAPQVAQYALKEGFPYEVITGHDRNNGQRVGPGVVDPAFARALYKAMQWDQLQAQKATNLGKAKNAPPVLKPGATQSAPNAQIAKMNFRKALKSAGSDSRKAELIGDRIAGKFFGS
jgi:hypothetical protein